MSADGFFSALTGWLRPSENFVAARAYILGAAPETAATLRALAGLQGRERRKAVELALCVAPTPRTMAALGALATPGAQRRLGKVFACELARLSQAPDACGALLIAAASAWWRFAPQDSLVQAVADRLRAAPAQAERVQAADALGAMAARSAEAALIAALDDLDRLVRHAAARALLAQYGLEVDARASAILQRRLGQGSPGAPM